MEMSNIRKDIEEMKEHIKRKFSEVQSDMEDDARKVNSTITKNVENIVELGEHLQANEARISEVQTSVTHLAEELTDHRKDVSMSEFVTSLADSISDVNETVASNSYQIASLKEDSVRNDLIARISSVEENVDMNQEKISKAQVSVNLLSKDFTNITDIASRVVNGVVKMDDNVQALGQSFENVKTNVKGNSAKLTDVSEHVSFLTSSNQKQEILIENNMQRLNKISKRAKWCGYQNDVERNSIIQYDYIYYTNSNLDIMKTPLDIKTGNKIIQQACFIIKTCKTP